MTNLKVVNIKMMILYVEIEKEVDKKLEKFKANEDDFNELKTIL